MENNLENWVKEIIKPAGILINGPNDWDIQVNNPDFYNRVKALGSIGLGESYMDGWWDCKKLDDFFYRILYYDIQSQISLSLPVILGLIKARLFNLQAIKRTFQVGEKHYDIGNDLFNNMLGKSMAYSCGYWKKAKNLDQASEAKFDLVCKKLRIRGDQKILDIGCGWGSLAYYVAKKYKARVLGITVSKEQVKFAKELCKGLPVEIRLQDYRELSEQFDHIVSVGMFEHVGTKNYRTFFDIAKKCLKNDGLFLLHTIGSLKTKNSTDPWIGKYIFPNGMLPSLKQITTATEGLFVIEDLHNFGADYEKTLMAWHANFEKSWTKLKSKYGDHPSHKATDEQSRFYRMWNYYLLSCAGAFRARSIQLWQIVLSPHGVPKGYKAVR